MSEHKHCLHHLLKVSDSWREWTPSQFQNFLLLSHALCIHTAIGLSSRCCYHFLKDNSSKRLAEIDTAEFQTTNTKKCNQIKKTESKLQKEQNITKTFLHKRQNNPKDSRAETSVTSPEHQTSLLPGKQKPGIQVVQNTLGGAGKCRLKSLTVMKVLQQSNTHVTKPDIWLTDTHCAQPIYPEDSF